MREDQAYVVIAEPLAVQWLAQGEEWMSRFSLALESNSSGIRFDGYRYDITTQPFIDITVTADTAEARGEFHLLLGVLPDAIALVVRAGESAPPVPSGLIEAWYNAAQLATQSMGDRGVKHDWSAIIGPQPSRHSVVRVGIDTDGLAAPASVGSMRLESTGKYLLEWNEIPNHPSFGARSGSSSIPILVTGSHYAYSWDKAAVAVANDLARLCAILSSSWSTCIVVRESPAALTSGLRQVPDKALGLPGDYTPEVPPHPVVDLVVPEWAEQAWTRVKSSVRINDAALSYHEGMKIESSNPTLSMVAYVASIEAISQLLFHDNRCPICRTYLDIRHKFMRTLCLVMPRERAQMLAAAYASRSLTVHRGRMHGTESLVGANRIGPWALEPRQEFWHESVYPIREASRQLLILAFKGELPKKSKMPSD